MLDAKLAGKGVSVSDEPKYDHSNVVDIMTALRKSLGEPTPASGKKAAKVS